jgi:hypothetical protein
MAIEFARYESAARFTRDRLNITRLSPQQKAEIQAAVEKHNQRQGIRLFYQQNEMAKLLTKRDIRVAGAVTPIVKKLYRMATSSWAGGCTSISINVSQQPDARGETQKVWSKNGKWSGRNLYLCVNVQPAWRKYIASVPGLPEAGGMLTTHAVQIKDDCWQASWVRQGRGYDLVAESGYIVRIGEQFFHGKTEEAARKVAKNRAAFDKVSEHLRAITTVDQLIAQFGSLVVKRSDSLRSGNCQEGTDNWIELHFPGQDEATIKELLIADSSASVIAACKAAILRQSRQLRMPKATDAVLGLEAKCTDLVLSPNDASFARV